jgi:glycosyltransferase involved in cell wall biosynthesis
MAAADTRIRLYVNEVNLGDYPNRNRAASYASGKYIKYVDADDLIYPRGLQILVETMESFPGAGWGLCSLPQDNNNIFPFLLDPQGAYRYHYLGKGLFNKAPLSSIIRRNAFHALGGFNNIRMAGDFDMWHRMAQQFPVVLMQQGIVWYRTHDAQEMNFYNDYEMLYEQIRRKYLFHESCPLNAADRKLVTQLIKKKYTKEMLKSILRLSRIRSGYRKWKYWQAGNATLL